MINSKVLIIDNNPALHSALSQILAAHGYESDSAFDGFSAISLVQRNGHKVVICDMKMPGLDGKETVVRLREIDPEIIVIIHTAYEGAMSQEDFVSLNIFDLIVKPPSIPRLLSSVRRAFQLLEAGEQVNSLRKTLQIITDWSFSKSQEVRSLINEIHSIAWVGTNAVIYGESGTGKTVLAHALHHLSRRAKGPFIKVDIGTISDNVAESELFGHKKGAFTGADRDKEGLLSSANRGTLFLDEIQNMSSYVQMRLLNAVEHRSVRPVGATTEVHSADFRLICATNDDLRALVLEKKFRNDLFYRIQESAIHVPPLRERCEDIPLIAQKILEEAADTMEVPAAGISQESLRILQSYSWPGNIRELKNVMRHALAICDGSMIMPIHLTGIKAYVESSLGKSSLEPRSLEEIEREAIIKALRRADGNKTKASQELKIDYKTLLNKIKRYNIQ